MEGVLRWTVVLILAQLFEIGSTFVSETWVACSVDLVSLEDSNLQNEVYQGLTSLRCLSMATHLSWPFLACYDSSQVCTLWEFGAIGAGGVVKDTSNAPGLICKIPNGFIGCLQPDGTMLAPGDTVANSLCTTSVDTCTEDGMVTSDPAVASAPTLTSCSDPFEQTSFGCIFATPDEYTWCTARSYCQSLGADLMSLDSIEDFTAYQNHQSETVSGNGNNFFVGVQYLDGMWQWLGGGEIPEAEWYTDEPSKALPDNACTTTDQGKDFFLKNVDCTVSEKLAVCEVKL